MITNILTALVKNPKELPFALVNMVIGICVGVLAKRFKYNFTTAIIIGGIVAIIAPLLGTPISVYLYGGVANGSLDTLVESLKRTGETLLTATFITRLASNFIDKIFSCILIWLVIKKIPTNILKTIEYKQ